MSEPSSLATVGFIAALFGASQVLGAARYRKAFVAPKDHEDQPGFSAIPRKRVEDDDEGVRATQQLCNLAASAASGQTHKRDTHSRVSK